MTLKINRQSLVTWLCVAIGSVIGLFSGLALGVNLSTNALFTNQTYFVTTLATVEASVATNDLSEARRRLDILYLKGREQRLDEFYESALFLNEHQAREWRVILEKRKKGIEQ